MVDNFINAAREHFSDDTLDLHTSMTLFLQ